MAFKLTYTDGQESDYDDGTKWDVDGGVLKLGREDGEWTVFVSPGHWATIEIGKGEHETEEGRQGRQGRRQGRRTTTRTTRTTIEAQTSMREPMLTVRSSGRLKYAAASDGDVGRRDEKPFAPIRHRGFVARDQLELGQEVRSRSTSMWPSVCAGSSRRSAAGMFGLSMYP